MSGHSKWKNIQHKKEKTDAQRASVFTKIGKEMAGDAAYDYVLLAELDQKKNALEERLLEIYEEIGV